MSTVRDHEPQSWIPTTEHFGARLVLIRQHEGWNAKEAAIACGLPAQSWRDWEAGANPRDMVAVCRSIAVRTGADFYWLLAGESGPGGHPFRESEELAGSRGATRTHKPAGYFQFTNPDGGYGALPESYAQSKSQTCNKQAA